MEIQSATGFTGHLLDDFCGGYNFRVYNKDKTFVDYRLTHTDLVVKILDADAAFYVNEDGDAKLDHSAETLGYRDRAKEALAHPDAAKELSEDEQTLLHLWREYAVTNDPLDKSATALGAMLRSIVAGTWNPKP
jgi:hypothetical protein